MKVETKQMPGLRLGTVRHIGPYHQISEAFDRLATIAGAAGLSRQPAMAMMALYHDDPDSTPDERLRSDAAISIAGDASLPDGLAEQHLPAGRYACTEHVGPYESLGDSWQRFREELRRSGYRMREGPSYEIYLNTPGEVPEEGLKTELYIPIH